MGRTGCAVDLSLFDLATGAEVAMPSAYDEMSARSSPDYAGGSAEERARRDLLRRAAGKPLNLTLVQQHIIAALDRYQQFRAVPQLVQSQKAAGAGAARNTSLGRSILERLKTLRGRVVSTFRT